MTDLSKTEQELVEQLTNKFYAACVELDDEEERKNAQDEIRENIMPLIRSYAATERAGMREACAALIGNYKFLCEENERAYASAKRIFSQAIRDVPDTAADEAIERIKREAERKWRFLANELHWLAKWQHEGRDPGHCNPNTEDCPHHACKRATAALAAWEGALHG